jgi:hypothetical protein
MNMFYRICINIYFFIIRSTFSVLRKIFSKNANANFILTIINEPPPLYVRCKLERELLNVSNLDMEASETISRIPIARGDTLTDPVRTVRIIDSPLSALVTVHAVLGDPAHKHSSKNKQRTVYGNFPLLEENCLRQRTDISIPFRLHPAPLTVFRIFLDHLLYLNKLSDSNLRFGGYSMNLFI